MRIPLEAPLCDSFGGAAMILADKLDYDTVMEAMERGEMYSTMGPTFREVSFDGENIHVECSEVVKIYCHFGSKAPTRVVAEPGQTLTCADLKVGKRCKYVRVSIMDTQGRCADTRGYFRDELGLPPAEE